MSGLLSRNEIGVRPRVGVVVLTMGQRPTELSRAIKSVLSQQLVILDVVVVGNGWRPEFLPAGVRGLHLAENVGIPAGRNAGAAKVSGEYIFFLDDDAELADPLFLAEGIKKFQDAYDAGVKSNPGKLPVVEFKDSIAKTSGEGQKRSTNYVPVFEIVGWVKRPEDLVYQARSSSNDATASSPPSTGSTKVSAPVDGSSDEEDFG